MRIIFDHISCIISVEDENVDGVTPVGDAPLQWDPLQRKWQVDSFSDGQFQGAFEESESQSKGEKASDEISKQERAKRMAKKMREDGK